MGDRRVILVVEDDDQTALFMSHILEREGYAVKVATNGEEVAEKMEEGLAALVTLDIDLPDTTGDELMLKFKTTPGWDVVPIVMVTGKPKGTGSTWAVKTGSKAHLEKPFKPKELIDCVNRLLAR